MKNLVFVFLFGLILCVGCFKSPTEPTPTPTCTIELSAHAAGGVVNLSWTTDCPVGAHAIYAGNDQDSYSIVAIVDGYVTSYTYTGMLTSPMWFKVESVDDPTVFDEVYVP
jgi:hypothetical protein